jgi:hypothetical protein
MPITQGYGSDGNSGGSGFEVTAITPGAAYLDLQFTGNVAALTMQAADPAYWVFGTTGPVAITATSLAVSTNTVRVYHTEPHAGDLYTLTMPLNGLRSTLGETYGGDDVLAFTAVAQAPTIFMAQSVDSRTLRIIFTESVVGADALDTANWTITGSGGLAVLGVTQETTREYLLTTSPQTAGASYTVTAYNIRDLALNPV